MNFTPSIKGSFIAGMGLWCLLWGTLLKADEIAEAFGLRGFANSERCLRWIGRHKSASLVGTEVFNFGTHGISDPASVTFALAGTLVNALMIYVFLPSREIAKRSRMMFTVRL